MSDLDALLSLCLASAAPATPDSLWSAWSFAPAVLAPLVLSAFLYARGAYAIAARGGPGLKAGEIACFTAGWLALAVALVSPLCRLSATLVSAHMVQHVLLVAVAAPLLVSGAALNVMRTGLPATWATRTSRRRKYGLMGGRKGTAATIATVVYGLAIWLWHIPAIYRAVLLDPVVHALAYVALIAASLYFWSAVLGTRGAARGGAVVCVLATLVHTGLLAALLTFSPRSWYGVLAERAVAWGLTPEADQQLAGLIMWVPMGIIYLLSALTLAATLLASRDGFSRA